MINVLREIVQWSVDRPLWQRDALRRLVTNGPLHSEDIAELSQLCKSGHGLAERLTATPLKPLHIGSTGVESQPVVLQSLRHHSGVNALAHNQTIEFGPSLTVVYGANAAGKSGYTRILKRACRARGAEEILGNVVSGTAPGRPSATIAFRVGDQSADFLWNDDDTPPNPNLSRVSVFDRHCASVYVSQRTDVAFRPLGLDLFDKLSAACETVKKALEKERNALESQGHPTLSVAPGTTVHDLVRNLTSLTDPDSVRELASLSVAETDRHRDMQRRLRDLESDDPGKIARTLELRVNRLETLLARVRTVLDALSDPSIDRLFAARDESEETREVVEALRLKTLEQQPLPNTGSAAWRSLWEAARQFSMVDAYPDHSFPHTGEDSLCVFCQQELSDQALQRLTQFNEFVESTAQSEHSAAAARYRTVSAGLHELVLLDDAVNETLDELQIDAQDIAAKAQAFLGHAETRRNAVLGALAGGLPRPQNGAQLFFDTALLVVHIDDLRDRVRQLREPNQQRAIKELQNEVSELDARKLLARDIDQVLRAIERKKRIAAYQLCIEETRTNAITRKSSEVTKRAVTEQLAMAFGTELEALRFRHVEVRMVDSGGSRGSLYHKLQLRRAPGVDVSKIVSEGEARCLSIASFFAELCTAADRSAILFDDPVSSLDHHWRENVAKRLVAEARDRQVIVFTHDIVFLLALAQKAEELDVGLQHQYLRRDLVGAGLSSRRLPWAAMKVKDRIGHLKDLQQAAEKVYRTGDREQYERDAQFIYGLLRAAWERGFEEVLLSGTVERYRNSVQTQQAQQLADICEADCRALDAGMTKSSRWLPGHDQAPAENAPIPDPQEIDDDIKALEDWIGGIRKRRRKKSRS